MINLDWKEYARVDKKIEHIMYKIYGVEKRHYRELAWKYSGGGRVRVYDSQSEDSWTFPIDFLYMKLSDVYDSVQRQSLYENTYPDLDDELWVDYNDLRCHLGECTKEELELLRQHRKEDIIRDFPMGQVLKNVQEEVSKCEYICQKCYGDAIECDCVPVEPASYVKGWDKLVKARESYKGPRGPSPRHA